jgi:anthranilate phosphoribosyltransferase
VLGVARREWLEPVAEALAALGLERALVVHGTSAEGPGMDEASLDGPTLVLPVRCGRLQSEVCLLPEGLGARSDLTPAGAGSKEACVALARGLAGGPRHPDFSPRVAEEVALQAALGLALVRDRPLADLGALMAEAREALEAGLHLPTLLSLAA